MLSHRAAEPAPQVAGGVRPFRERALLILWPAFVMAGVLEALVFAVVDPESLHWFGSATALDWSASAVYSVTFLIFWVVGANARTSEFLISTDMEMKKVNWGTRKDIVGSTWVVIGAAFIIAAFIYGVDWSFSMIFKAIGLLVS